MDYKPWELCKYVRTLDRRWKSLSFHNIWLLWVRWKIGCTPDGCNWTIAKLTKVGRIFWKNHKKVSIEIFAAYLQTAPVWIVSTNWIRDEPAKENNSRRIITNIGIWDWLTRSMWNGLTKIARKLHGNCSLYILGLLSCAPNAYTYTI